MTLLLVSGDRDSPYQCLLASWWATDSTVTQKEMCHIMSHQHHRHTPRHLCSSNLGVPSESCQWPHLTCGSLEWWKQQMSSLWGKNTVETFSYCSGDWHLKCFVLFFFCFWEGWTTAQVFEKWKAITRIMISHIYEHFSLWVFNYDPQLEKNWKIM